MNRRWSPGGNLPVRDRPVGAPSPHAPASPRGPGWGLQGCAARCAAFAVLVGCGSEPPKPAPTPSPPPAAAVEALDAGLGIEADPIAFEEAPLDQRIAAIERGMNALAPVAQQCWAAAATDDFRLAGDVRVAVSIPAEPGAKASATITSDSTGDAVLTRCLTAVVAEYAWARPLRGQDVELPFHFAAPAMQNVIDARFVAYRGQTGVEVGVLLDEISTGNPALSLVEARFSAGASNGPRELERAEVWVFLTPAVVTPMKHPPHAVAAGDVMLAPAGSAITVAGAQPARALIGVVPGGREGAVRAGALPGRRAAAHYRAPPPVFVAAATAKRYARTGGASTFAIEPPLANSMISVTFLELDAGVKVPLHTHAKETEALYVTAGGGTMTVGAVELPVTEHSVVQIPAGIAHGFVATQATRAIQVYVPAGPEQRFKKMK